MSRPANRSPQLRFITRMQDSLWRVWVQFGRLDFGQEYFSDAQYGGMQEAKRAAIERRDALVKAHKIPLRKYEGNGWHAKSSRNKSGQVGISLFLDDPECPTRISWGVRVTISGTQRNIIRSIRKYGYASAWRMVAKIRAKHTGQPISMEPPPAPEWLVSWAAERKLDLSK